MIRVPLPFPRLSWVNAYVIATQDGPVIIDCGVDSQEGFSALMAGLTVFGLEPSDVKMLIGTHLHVDHVGMAGHVMEATGCRFAMHSAAPSRFREYSDWEIGNTKIAELADRHGASPEEVTEVRSTLPRPDWAPVAATPTDLFADGDDIDLGGGRSLKVIHTPGHDEAHICLLDSKSGLLFSGDHVLPRITPVVLFDPDGTDRLATYMDSLERIERLDVARTLPAHGTQIDRGSLRARQIVLHHERRLGAIVHELRQRGPATAWQLMESLFRPHLNVFERRLAFSETLAHLEHLRVREELQVEEDEGSVYFQIPDRRPH